MIFTKEQHDELFDFLKKNYGLSGRSDDFEFEHNELYDLETMIITIKFNIPGLGIAFGPLKFFKGHKLALSYVKYNSNSFYSTMLKDIYTNMGPAFRHLYLDSKLAIKEESKPVRKTKI